MTQMIARFITIDIHTLTLNQPLARTMLTRKKTGVPYIIEIVHIRSRAFMLNPQQHNYSDPEKITGIDSGKVKICHTL